METSKEIDPWQPWWIPQDKRTKHHQPNLTRRKVMSASKKNITEIISCITFMHGHLGTMLYLRFRLEPMRDFLFHFSENPCINLTYLNTIFPYPTGQVVVFFLVTRMVCIKNDVAISTVEFTNLFLGNWCFSTSIDAPDLNGKKNVNPFRTVVIVKTIIQFIS